MKKKQKPSQQDLTRRNLDAINKRVVKVDRRRKADEWHLLKRVLVLEEQVTQLMRTVFGDN